jgi:hypothetical protein
MSVHVYSTGSIIALLSIGPFQGNVTINNRNITPHAYRIILFDTTPGKPKTVINEVSNVIPANETIVQGLFVNSAPTSTITAIEVEIRLEYEHMTPWTVLAYTTEVANHVGGIPVIETIYADEFFYDFSATENA